MDSTTIDMIEAMERAKLVLKTIQSQDQNESYKEVCRSINQFIETHCTHTIMYDLIDINPDVSKTIRYCTHCNKTFD